MGKVVKLECKTDSPISEICWNCKNFDGDNPSARQCSAFPKGIPSEIWSGKNDHTKPFPGDNGIRFVPIEILRAA